MMMMMMIDAYNCHDDEEGNVGKRQQISMKENHQIYIDDNDDNNDYDDVDDHLNTRVVQLATTDFQVIMFSLNQDTMLFCVSAFRGNEVDTITGLEVQRPSGPRLLASCPPGAQACDPCR